MLNDSALAFQHQLKRRRVAAHAVGRQAEQPLHVGNRAARWRLDDKHAAAIAARASNRHLDGSRSENGACSAGGGGRLLHGTIAISRAAREREKGWEKGLMRKEEQKKRGGSAADFNSRARRRRRWISLGDLAPAYEPK